MKRYRGRTRSTPMPGRGTTNQHGIIIIMYSTVPVSSSPSSGALFVPAAHYYNWLHCSPVFMHITIRHYPPRQQRWSIITAPPCIHTRWTPSTTRPSIVYTALAFLRSSRIIYQLISITLHDMVVIRRPAINQTSATNGAPILIPCGHHYDDNSYRIMLLRHVRFDHRLPPRNSLYDASTFG